MNKGNIGKGIIMLAVLVAFVVGVGVFLYSCANEKQRVAVRAKASPVAKSTGTAEQVRAAAYEKARPNPTWAVAMVAARDAQAETVPGVTPPDKRFLSTKDRLKVTAVEAMEAYTKVREDAAFIRADLNGDQARFQTSGAYRKYENQRKVATEKMADLRKKFLAETGITVDEAAAAFEPKK